MTSPPQRRNHWCLVKLRCLTTTWAQIIGDYSIITHNMDTYSPTITYIHIYIYVWDINAYPMGCNLTALCCWGWSKCSGRLFDLSHWKTMGVSGPALSWNAGYITTKCQVQPQELPLHQLRQTLPGVGRLPSSKRCWFSGSILILGMVSITKLSLLRTTPTVLNPSGNRNPLGRGRNDLQWEILGNSQEASLPYSSLFNGWDVCGEKKRPSWTSWRQVRQEPAASRAKPKWAGCANNYCW